MSILQDEILKIVKTRGKKRQIYLSNGSEIEVYAVLFSSLFKDILKRTENVTVREVKKEVSELVSVGKLKELSGEPPYILLKEDYDKIFGAKNDISLSNTEKSHAEKKA